VSALLDELRQSLAGAVIEPDDPDYDAARRCYNAAVDRRPAVIARCAGTGDLATAFDFARTHDLEVAVRGGGHNPAGHCVLDGGLVIDLSLMRGVDVVDGDAPVARAEGGATWLDFDSATQAVGLATPGGVVGSTGVAGLTFGGGIGHLTAQHGLTCDNLVGAELVTPAGDIVRAAEDENPDLLWALRGGGGNFGVATRLEFRLHPVERVVGGLLSYRGEGVRDALRALRNVVADSPRHLSCQVVLDVDEAQTPALVVAPCHTGVNREPDELLALRTAPGLVDDGLSTRTFGDQQRMFGQPYGTRRLYWKGHFVKELPDELVDELIERVGALGRPTGGILIEALHGGSKDVDPRTSALAWRGAAFNVSATANWADAADDERFVRWARETAAAIEPWAFGGGGYVNYMQADEPIERVRAAFGAESFERLQALKKRYDPENVLHRNQNIPPNDEGGETDP
jgi:FAD/FMN-containing dehydrogenase